MKRRLAALAALGLAALMLQSVAASQVPAAFVPDLVLLVAVAAAVQAPAVEGLLLAALLGYGADLFSGALLGHHALLRMGAWTLTRTVSGQLHLQRSLSLAAFAGCLTLLDALGSAGLHFLFHGELLAGPEGVTSLLVRATMNGIFAPLVNGLMREVLERLTERETRRRDVRLDTRRPVL